MKSTGVKRALALAQMGAAMMGIGTNSSSKMANPLDRIAQSGIPASINFATKSGDKRTKKVNNKSRKKTLLKRKAKRNK